MKILVIFTGGTIGSLLNDGWISPDGHTKRELIRHYEKAYGKDVAFVTKEPYSILSENLSADEINLLVKTVCDSAKQDYDGIIVTHGTDTLQYSAAALSFALGKDSIPVLLVSSNFPLDDPRTNGHVNFAAAVEFIKEKKGRGVFVAYRNDNRPVRFHRGISILTHREADDSVYSIGGKHYAELTENGVAVINENEGNDIKAGDFSLCDSPKVLVVDACPGELYEYNVENYNAVILRPYHSGTLNTADGKFEAFCLRADKSGVPVFVVNVKEGETYLSSKEFDRLKIIPVYSSTFVSTYVRLWIAISRDEDLKDIFN